MQSATPARSIGVSVIGMGWMGCVHARAFSQISRLSDVGVTPRLALCSDSDSGRLEWARQSFGFESATADWRELVAAPQTDIVCIAAPTFMHADMACAAAEAGKHIYCEKPAGRNLAETARAEKAAREAGVMSASGYNYLHFPVVQYCRQLLKEGRLGAVEQFNARFLSMYGGDPMSRLTWRFQNDKSGSGAVGDILSHAADMAQCMAGRVTRVCAQRRTFIAERPIAPPGGDHFARGEPGDPKGPVENEDYVGALAQYAGADGGSGAVGMLEASRVARGPKCEAGFELYAEKGSARWNFERMNELQLYLPDGDPAREGYSVLLGGGAHPGHACINPGDGIGVGYEDSKLLEAAALLRDIAAGRQERSGLAQALDVARVNDAVLRSCESGRWEDVTAA